MVTCPPAAPGRLVPMSRLGSPSGTSFPQHAQGKSTAGGKARRWPSGQCHWLSSSSLAGQVHALPPGLARASRNARLTRPLPRGIWFQSRHASNSVSSSCSRARPPPPPAGVLTLVEKEQKDGKQNANGFPLERGCWTAMPGGHGPSTHLTPCWPRGAGLAPGSRVPCFSGPPPPLPSNEWFSAECALEGWLKS